MREIVAIHKFVVDGGNAEKIFEIFKTSYFVQNNCQPFNEYHVEVQFEYADGVLRLEERTTGHISYLAEILYFFADRENVFSMSEYMEDGVVLSYTVDDIDGKYFVRPPKTQWELEQEKRFERGEDDDLPF
jgi:hypothetical protein